MNQIEIFNSPEFGSIRTLEQNGKVLFCGTDVATTLGYTNPRKAVRDHTRDGTKCSIGVQTGKKADGSPAVQMVEMLFIKEFEKIARKYGVDYAVKKDRSSSPPKYLIFFKGRDADALTAAFTEYTGKKVRKAEKSERPSVLAKLSQFKELVKHAVVDRNKRKELER